jgi:hypothetical protein
VACVRKSTSVSAGSTPQLTEPKVACRRSSNDFGQIRAALFLGLEEEYLIEVGPCNCGRCRRTPTSTGDTVEVSIRPQNCMVLIAAEDE